MSKKLLLAVSVFLWVFGLVPMTRAHVLITDDSGTIGAILHVTPDDDPAVGEPANLFFDIQSQSFSRHAHDVRLEIVGENGAAVVVPVEVIGSSVSATYIFPAQGTYKIVLTANAFGAATDHAHTFTHTQRVSRGQAVSAFDKPSHAWAEALVVAGICGFLVVGIVAYNRRKEIAGYSKF